MSSSPPEAAPAVTILLSTFNGERYLKQQLDTIAAQSHTDWRLHISDDGSTDRTKSIVERWSQNEPRVRMCDATPGSGPAASYLQLLTTVETPYFAFCDQDDLWLPDRLKHSLGLLERARPDASGSASDSTKPSGWMAMVATDAELIGSEGESIGRSALDHRRVPANGVSFGELLMLNAAIGNTVTGTRELAVEAVRIASGRPVVMHDWWLALVAASRGTFILDRTPTVQFRRHDAAATYALEGEWGWQAMRSRAAARQRTQAVFERCVGHARYLADALDAAHSASGEALMPSGANGNDRFIAQARRLAIVNPSQVTIAEVMKLSQMGVRMWPASRHFLLVAGARTK